MKKKVICFGEVLWDVFPSGREAGGAPMNVAIRLQSLGISAKIISKIGKDDFGTELISIIKNKNVDTSLVQKDDNLPTGKVIVKLDSGGSATYDIVHPSAWDKIDITDENISAVQNSDAFVFGSLASRDEFTKNTLLKLLDSAKYKIFDVNLRPPFYKISLLKELMNKSDFIKLNDDELKEISEALGSTSKDLNKNILFLSKKTNTKTICVTKGKEGAILYTEEKFYSNNGFKVKVADTVGAGDSFLAGLISKFLTDGDYQNAITFACAIGSKVAASNGANPDIDLQEIHKMINRNSG